MKGIFISYRREDSAGYAGRLYDRLAAHFGAERVFMDVEGIEPGVDFVEAIERAVGSCEALIVIIGRDWLAVDGSGKRRLDDPADFVRIETAAALARSIRVVPVLVDDAPMPRADQLPPELAPLARRQAVELSHKHWDATSAELINTLEKVLDSDKPKRAAATSTPAHARAPAAEPSTTVQPAAQAAGSGERPGSRYLILAAAALAVAAVAVTLYLLQPWQDDVDTTPTPRVAQAPAVADKAPSTPPSQPATSPERKPEPPAPEPPTPELKPAVPAPSPAAPSERKPEPPAPAPAPERKPEPTAPKPAPERKPEPAAPVPPPERKPEVAAAPPKILHFESRVADGRVLLCYGVENATSATIRPAPGAVKPLAKECVPVSADESRSYTLTARSAAGAVVTRTLAVEAPSPPPPQLVTVPNAIGRSKDDALAALEKAGLEVRIVEDKLDPNARGPADSVVAQLPKPGERLKAGGRVTLQVMPRSAPPLEPPPAAFANKAYPRVGDVWEYRSRSLWKTVEPRTFTHRVAAVSEGEVREYMGSAGSPDKSSEGKSFGTQTRFVEWRGSGYYFVEFNPFLQALGTLQPRTAWKGIPTPSEDPSFTNWYSSGRALDWESVTVPAGTFKALRVEINSNRQVTASGAGRNEPTRIQYLVWYAPEVKRTVKQVRTVWSTTGARIDEDTYELTKYRVQ